MKPYNIRTTVISPGAIDTELPNSVSDPEAGDRIRKFYATAAIPGDSFARMVAFAMSQPDDVDINEFLFRPDEQDDVSACPTSSSNFGPVNRSSRSRSSPKA